MKKKLLIVLFIIVCIFLATVAAGSKNDVVNSLSSENNSFENSAEDNSESPLPEEPSSTESNEEDSSNSSTESNEEESSNSSTGEVTIDELHGIWRFNEEPYGNASFISDGEITYLSLNFSCDNTTYTKLGFVLGDDDMKYDRQTWLYFGDTVAYNAKKDSFSWSNEKYRTIEIYSRMNEVEHGAELLEWLKENAEKLTHGGGNN